MWGKLVTNLDAWAILGLAAQAAFTGRFLVQWIASERTGRSVIPVSFWYLSLFGSAGLLLYAIGRADPVFILGQSFGSVVYIRNLALIRRERRSGNRLPGEHQQDPHAQTTT
jgi:lipid-A-disaccharide synthase-like uncharacterized protein